MKQITQKELKEFLIEKQNNATNMEESLRIRATSRDDLDTAKKCLGEARAYQDMLCYLECVEIVPDKKLLEPICNKCSMTAESCPFHRMGSAYETCSSFQAISEPEEQIKTTIPKAKQEELGLTEDDLKEMINNTSKTDDEPKTCYNCADHQKCEAHHMACNNGSAWKPARYDSFREFFFDNGARRIIDAKAVKSISLEESYTTKGGYDVYVDSIIMKKGDIYDYCKKCYDDLVEWWKYWKIRG